MCKNLYVRQKNMYHASEEIFTQYFKVLKFYKLGILGIVVGHYDLANN